MLKYYKNKHNGLYIKVDDQTLTEEELANFVEVTEAEYIEFTSYGIPYTPTAEQIAKGEKLARISFLKEILAKTDYIVIKIAESVDPDEIAALRTEYAQVIADRKATRAEINELEAELANND